MFDDLVLRYHNMFEGEAEDQDGAISLERIALLKLEENQPL